MLPPAGYLQHHKCDHKYSLQNLCVNCRFILQKNYPKKLTVPEWVEHECYYNVVFIKVIMNLLMKEAHVRELEYIEIYEKRCLGAFGSFNKHQCYRSRTELKSVHACVSLVGRGFLG